MDHKGLIGTIAFHGILLILFLFLGFKTPLPLPAEQGILINFGDSPTGSGEYEPIENVQQKKEIAPQPKQPDPAPVKEQILTQDFEDAPAIEAKPKKENKKTIEKPVEKPVETKPVEEKPVEAKPRTADARAMYPSGKKAQGTQSSSEGETEGSGNQGDLSGSVDATSRSLGFGEGDGISASLAGRSPLSLSKPTFNHQVEGKVVVEVTVDRSGNVVNAVPGVKGSTTLDSYLLAAAKKAALSSKFNEKNDAAFQQKGTITYYFRLE